MSELRDEDQYELVDRVWSDVMDTSREDSVFVEIIAVDGQRKVKITCLTNDGSIAVDLAPREARKLRNALNRALNRALYRLAEK